MAMLHPLKLVCQSCLTIVLRYLTKFHVLQEELVDIIPPRRPCVWLSKREVLSQWEHDSIDLSGGIIRTSANFVCWFWYSTRESSRCWVETNLISASIFVFWNSSRFCCKTVWTSRLGWFAGKLKVLYMWLFLKIILLYKGIVWPRSYSSFGIPSAPSRKWHPVSRAITVHALLLVIFYQLLMEIDNLAKATR